MTARIYIALGVAVVAFALSWRPGFADDGAQAVADDLHDAIQTAQNLKDHYGN